MVTATPLTQPIQPIKFDSQDTFMLTNTGDKTITFTLPKQKFIIQPGQRAFVPFNLIRIYFGDPRSIVSSRRMFEDSSGKGTIPAREAEVDRLKTIYGVYGEDEQTLTDVRPEVEIKSVTGTTIYPPLYDRDGSKSQPLSPMTASDVASLEDLSGIIAQQQAQLNQLLKLQQQAGVNQSNTTTDVEVDMSTDMLS